MYDEYLVNSNLDVSQPQSSAVANLDDLFNNLTNDVQNFNKYITQVNKQKKKIVLKKKNY